MAYYINLNGKLTEVSEEEYRLYNIGTPSNPAGGGSLTVLNNTQQILDPNTTNNIPGNQLSLQDQIAAVAAQQVPTVNDAATNQQIAAIERIQANRAIPQPPQTTEQAVAAVAAEQFNPEAVTSDDPETAAVLAAQAEADAVVAEQNQIVDDQDPFEAARVRAEQEYNNQEPEVFGPGDLGVDALPPDELAALEAQQAVNRQTLINEDTLNGQAEQAAKLKAQDQATLAARYKAPSQGDWRVRLVLAANSDYLYKAPPGAALEDDILRPLRQNNGVIFPYTPSISTSYSAYYDKYDLVHSNYRGYFYKSSAVNDINITAIFTAQDTWEAQYLLAVIHFFRSATKMFYGKDLQRGAPPPILYLFGHGQYQFNGHPCVVSNFNYNLPADVDYIRCNAPNNFGTSLLNRLGGNSPTSTLDWLSSTWSRLTNSNLVKGAEPQGGAGSNTGVVPGSVNNTTTSTYVPTKIEISITLLPVQSRAQVSQQFSLKNFANGNLLKGGFW